MNELYLFKVDQLEVGGEIRFYPIEKHPVESEWALKTFEPLLNPDENGLPQTQSIVIASDENTGRIIARGYAAREERLAQAFYYGMFEGMGVAINFGTLPSKEIVGNDIVWTNKRESDVEAKS